MLMKKQNLNENIHILNIFYSFSLDFLKSENFNAEFKENNFPLDPNDFNCKKITLLKNKMFGLSRVEKELEFDLKYMDTYSNNLLYDNFIFENKKFYSFILELIYKGQVIEVSFRYNNMKTSRRYEPVFIGNYHLNYLSYSNLMV